MIARFDTLLARLLLVSLLGISVVHLASLWTFEGVLHRELSSAQDVGLADRLMAIRRSVLSAPEGKREELAHDLSGGAIEAHWNKAVLPSDGRDPPDWTSIQPSRTGYC